MKILIVLLRLKGGVGRSNTEIAKVLRGMGHKVDILSREDDLGGHSLRSSFLSLREKIKELMRKENYDIIYTQDYSCTIPLLFPYPIFRSKHFACFCGIKSGKHPTLKQWDQKWMQYITGRIMGGKLVVIGDSLKERFSKATLIYRGVNTKEFRPLKGKRDFLGWTITHTDNEVISEKEVQEISKVAGLKVLIAKGVPPSEMNQFYNKCKVFINLPRTAGFNLAWLEAMASGVPIIIGNKNGAGRFLPIEKASEKNLKEDIIKIIKKPGRMDYRKWLIDNGFTWERKSEELIKFFEKMERK